MEGKTLGVIATIIIVIVAILIWIYIGTDFLTQSAAAINNTTSVVDQFGAVV